MRRAPVPLAALTASLLLAASVFASASSAADPPGRKEHDILFELHSGGFLVSVFGSDAGNRHRIELTVKRGGVLTLYEVPATFTDHSVAARFGTLGALDFEFRPTPGTRKCRGRLTFTGDLTFTGEDDYVEIDAHRARGVVFVEHPSPNCPPARQRQAFVRNPDAVLSAEAGPRPPGPGTRFVMASEYGGTAGHPRRVAIEAYSFEEREGMTIAKGASVVAGPAAFDYDAKVGTAVLRPPAPFLGDATLRPRPSGRSAWEGPLRMPTLGGEPVDLSGPEFHADLVTSFRRG